MTKYIISPTPGGGSPAFPPAGGINAMAYCHGDGVTDDRAHILAAIADAGANPVYFLAGTYLLSSALTVPDGTDLVGPPVSALAYPVSGCEVPTAHLSGALIYGSDSTFSDLRIGASTVNGVLNGATAHDTTFTRCQFRGGGSSGWPHTAPMYFGGGTNDATNITFSDCNIERNLCDYATAESNGANNVIWSEQVGNLSGSHMEYIYFLGCHFGVSNGRVGLTRNYGSPRMNVELYCDPSPDPNTGVRHGWHHVWFTDCCVEAGDMTCFNAPNAIYNNTHDDSYLYLEHSTFYGGGYAQGTWPFGIAIEGANYVTVDDCDIYPSYSFSFSFLATLGVDCNNAVITNNRFHCDDYSHMPFTTGDNQPTILLEGTSHTFTNNVLHSNPSGTGRAIQLWLGYFYDTGYGANMTITGNEFHELRTDALVNSMVFVYNCTGTTITGNTFRNDRAGVPEITYAGTNTATTVIDGTNNTLA